MLLESLQSLGCRRQVALTAPSGLLAASGDAVNSLYSDSDEKATKTGFT
ncbi:MAG: hypothetical protein AAF974_00500 [Cyanobacteria bacterium P01_E01_bin.34]